MESTIKLRWIIIIIVVLLGSYVGLCVRSNGEILHVIKGVIQKCDLLGGNASESISHATIKTELDSYIISSITDCGVGVGVNIYVKRGMLYFNTVYAAEKFDAEST